MPRSRLVIGGLLDTLGLRDPAQVRTEADLRTGKAVVYGTVSSSAPIRSPVNGRPCVAFYYRASFRRPSRITGFAQALLRDALVYADALVMTVGEVRIEVEPRSRIAFGRDDHQALVAQKIDGFRASEKRVPSGVAVAAHGTLKRKGDGWLLVLDQLDYEPPAESKKSRKKGAGKGRKKGR